MAKKKETPAPSPVEAEETKKQWFARAYLEASLDAVLQCVRSLQSAEVSFLDYTKRAKDSSVMAASLAQHGRMDEAFLGAFSFCMNHMQILTLQVTEARRHLNGRAMSLDTAFAKAKEAFEPRKLVKIVDEWSSDPIVEPHWSRMVKLYNSMGVRAQLIEMKS